MKHRGNIFRLILCSSVFILASVWSHYVLAQGFGRNKPHYKTFNFKVKESPHFLLHYYLQNDSLADELAAQSERWYTLHQQTFRDTITDKEKNPIIFYNNHADFQQTTAISGSIGVGTGGVTEGLRNRMVQPIMELNAQTDHVLGHEMVHMFQYRMLKNPEDSLSLTNIQNIPLWMIEGLAEYMSIGNVDPHTAMWMRDAVRTNDVPTLKQMTRSNEYFPYRYGQAFWSFVTGIYGDSIIYPLFKKTALIGYDDALKELTGLDEKAFSEAWKTRLTEYYNQFKPNTTDVLSGTLLIDKERAGEINIAPVLSPNGQYVAFLSEKNLFSIDLFLADANSGEVIRTLSTTAKQNHIDDLSYVESSGTWSPYSERFAHVVFSEGKNKLSIVDINGKTKPQIREIPGVPSFSNPSWSPNGETIIVSGVVEGQSDLYLFNLKSNTVAKLTNDRYSDLQPQWSPDGKFIVFTSDRPASGSPYDSRSLQICLLEVSNSTVSVLDIFPGAENYNPVFTGESNALYFLSNRDGFRNLYRYSLEQDVIHQLTEYFTGISGITASTPAISVAAKTGEVVYSYFANDGYTIYKARSSDFTPAEVSPYAVDFTAGTLPPKERKTNIINDGLNTLATIDVQGVVKTTPYKPKLSLEYIGNNVGVGISTSAFGTRTGLVGGVNAMFGDMLGYHKLFGTLALNGEIYDFGGQGIYLNQKNRINWGVSVSHIPYRYSYLGYQPDSLIVKDDTLHTTNLMLDVFRTFEKNISGFVYFPISTTKRIELGTGYSFYSFRLDRYNNHYYQGYKVAEIHDELDAPAGYRLGQTYAAYVFDNSYFGLASPMRGKRYRLEAEKVYDELDYHVLSADYRHYIFFNPTALAFRFIYEGRLGNDGEDDRLYPLSFAYPQYTRGNSLDNISNYSVQNDQGYSINQIFGSRIMVGNVEWRIPFSGPEQLALIPSKILFTELALFVDAGIAWDSFSKPVLQWNAESPTDRIPFVSTGVSLRLNLFGQVVIEPYYALPWRGDQFAKGVFGVNFLPGW